LRGHFDGLNRRMTLENCKKLQTGNSDFDTAETRSRRCGGSRAES
jgi:hypothetical protein